jgi:signal transduction histidine kinase
VGRPTVLIISDEAEFSRAITSCWSRERNAPVFVFKNSNGCNALDTQSFDLVIAGGLHCGSAEQLFDVIRAAGKLAIYVATDATEPAGQQIILLPESHNWPDMAVRVASRMLECEAVKAELARAQQQVLELEQQAALGRYMLEARHNLNNALTSVLGHSDLVLLDADELSPTVRSQIETIRNMSMRMNEIMQRFSSLQKEMQLVEQQSGKKKAKAARAQGSVL